MPRFKESAGWITRMAMCAEPRNGRLYVFMPPTEKLDDYLEIVAAVEATAEEMKMPVIMEGYEPPSDPRMTHFRVTPDPGVIEVNIHPAKSWDQLVDQTTHLYESAYYSRLTTEKFMVDGSPHRYRRRQPLRARWRHAQRFAFPPSARSAQEPDRLLAQPSEPVLSVLRPVHRPDQPGAARR